MAEVKLITCDNDCGWEAVETPEARASMVQVVVTQGGSRSHVYDLCPNCASGFATKLPDDPSRWPRYVAREAVQEWLRSSDREWNMTLEDAHRQHGWGARAWRVKVTRRGGTVHFEDPVWSSSKFEAFCAVRKMWPDAEVDAPEEVSGA